MTGRIPYEFGNGLGVENEETPSLVVIPCIILSNMHIIDLYMLQLAQREV